MQIKEYQLTAMTVKNAEDFAELESRVNTILSVWDDASRHQMTEPAPRWTRKRPIIRVVQFTTGEILSFTADAAGAEEALSYIDERLNKSWFRVEFVSHKKLAIVWGSLDNCEIVVE